MIRFKYGQVSVTFRWFFYLWFSTGNVNEPEPIALYSESSTLHPIGAKTDRVIIDATLGLNTEVTFDFASSVGVEISLQSPMGQSYDITSNECTLNSNIQIITCRFSQNSEVSHMNRVKYMQLHCTWMHRTTEFNLELISNQIILIASKYPAL